MRNCLFLLMKKEILQKIEIPENVEVEVSGNNVKVKSGEKENVKTFDIKNIELKKEGNEIVIVSDKATRREGKLIGTIRAHINNMIKGVLEGFEYKLEVAFVHFPMTVEISGNEIVIKNFLGEKKPRICKVIPNTEVSIDGNIITVKSHDKELAGQMAADIEKATRTRNKDTRKFQDGIYIVEKAGREI